MKGDKRGRRGGCRYAWGGLLWLPLWWSLWLPVTAVGEESLTLAVLAFRPQPEMVAHWQPLADHLSATLEGYRVRLVSANYHELEALLARHEADFVLTNPSHYIVLRERSSLSGVLATLEVKEGGYYVSGFGGVILARSDRDDIATLHDLPGKRVAAVKADSLGGYRVQAYELLNNGIAPERLTLHFTGMPHDRVVEELLAGRVDAGFVRTGVIEALAREGRLDLGQLKVIHQQPMAAFPFALSTRLYPEWPFVALGHVERTVVRQVAAALLQLGPEDATTQALSIQGFGIPADYRSVEELARVLRLPPFEHIPEFTWRDIFTRYGMLLVGLLLAVVTIILLLGLLAHRSRRLQLEHERLQKLAARVPGVLYQFQRWPDGRGCYPYISQRVTTLLGLLPEQLQQSAEALYRRTHPEDWGRVEQRIEQSQRELTLWQDQFRILRSDGVALWFEGEASPERQLDGSVLWYGYINDVSERRRQEQEIRALMAQLQKSNTELEQFAYVASHDLRQPLRMITSYVQMLERRLHEQLDEETLQMMHYISDGTQRMDQMLVSLLEYSRVGRTGEPMAQLESCSAVEEALRFLQPMIRESGAEIELVGEWPVIRASRDELTRLFQNLIGNAVKYRLPERPPRIRVTVSDGGSQWHFRVEDNGIGIDPEQIERLFRVFQRLHTRTQYEGTGVGLAISRKIVERHGGTIQIESEGEGKGSCCCFTLPK